MSKLFHEIMWRKCIPNNLHKILLNKFHPFLNKGPPSIAGEIIYIYNTYFLSNVIF